MQYDAGSYAKAVTYDASPAAGALPGCVDAVRGVWGALARAGATAEGRHALRGALGLCPDLPFESAEDVQALAAWLQVRHPGKVAQPLPHAAVSALGVSFSIYNHRGGGVELSPRLDPFILVGPLQALLILATDGAPDFKTLGTLLATALSLLGHRHSNRYKSFRCVTRQMDAVMGEQFRKALSVVELVF